MANANVVSPLSDPTNHTFYILEKVQVWLWFCFSLMEANYSVCSQAMIMGLDAKNKMGFLDGSMPKFNNGDPLKPYRDRNNKIVLA